MDDVQQDADEEVSAELEKMKSRKQEMASYDDAEEVRQALLPKWLIILIMHVEQDELKMIAAEAKHKRNAMDSSLNAIYNVEEVVERSEQNAEPINGLFTHINIS